MPVHEQLNPQQRRAVTTALGPTLVIAGPGSGKTRVLTHRIAYLIQEERVSPGSILAVTFTNKAAREMRSRVDALLGEDARHNTIRLGTFHANCARILRREAEALPFERSFVIYDDSDQIALTRDILKDLAIDSKKFQPRRIHAIISRSKNELLHAEDIAADSYLMEIVRRVFVDYNRRLLANNALDFDDLLLWTVRLFDENALIKARYRELYPHILVDEFQDTNTAQYALLRRMTADRPDLFVVGDPDQSIYRWRGADIRNVRRFQQDFPDAVTILLEQNYRSTQTILDVAMAVIDRNPNRQAKQLFTDQGHGQPVHLHEAYDERDEAREVVETIRTLTHSGRFKLADIAVMYRTNAQSRPLEEVFFQAGLNYRLVGAQRFYGRREIKDLIAYLRLIHNPSDQLSLLRVINSPSRGIGTKTVESLLAASEERHLSPSETLLKLADEDPHISAAFSGRAHRALSHFGSLLKSWLESRKALSTVTLMERILNDIRYEEYLDDGSEEGQDRWANVLELSAAAEEFADIGLETFLEHVALVSDQDTLTDEQNAPTLLTLHAAKGLEFPVVMIIGLDDGILPHIRSMDDPESMAEERRLFYVGITRAMKRLFLFRSFRRRLAGSSGLTDPSRFLADLPAKLVEGDNPFHNTWEKDDYTSTTRWDPAPEKSVSARYRAGMRVHHPAFGEGIVQESALRQGDEEVTVVFEDGSIKHLLASMAKLSILSDA